MFLFDSYRSRLAKLLLNVGFLALVTNSRVFGQSFVFYEFPGATNSPPATIGTDPSGGVPATTPVLIYSLPFAVVTGDVMLMDPFPPPPGESNLVSDIIRFFPNPQNSNQSVAIFYSDQETGHPPDDPADVPQLGRTIQPLPNLAGPFQETGVEGSNYYDYHPGAGMPGYASGVVDYLIISDVPEPSSFVLAGLGGGLLLLLRWRWSKRE